jgi:hypothetical protein
MPWAESVSPTAILKAGNDFLRPRSPFDGYSPRGAVWLEPRITVELTYSEVMQRRLRDPTSTASFP